MMNLSVFKCKRLAQDLERKGRFFLADGRSFREMLEQYEGDSLIAAVGRLALNVSADLRGNLDFDFKANHKTIDDQSGLWCVELGGGLNLDQMQSCYAGIFVWKLYNTAFGVKETPVAVERELVRPEALELLCAWNFSAAGLRRFDEALLFKTCEHACDSNSKKIIIDLLRAETPVL